MEYAQRAGDRALAQLAHDEAARYYASGLELLDASGANPADARRLELLIGRGEAQRRAGDPGYGETLLAAAHLARHLGNARALAQAALANTRGHLWNTMLAVDADRVEVLEAAIAAVGEDDLPLRARLLATLGLELHWEPDPSRRLALSAEALRIATSLGDPATLAPVLLARDYTITAPDNVTDRLAATTAVLAAAEQLGDPVLASRAAFFLGPLSATVGDWPAAEGYFADAAATHERIGAPSWLARTRVEWARMLLARAGPGDADRADDLLRLALGTARELGLLNIERGAAELLAQGDRVSDW